MSSDTDNISDRLTPVTIAAADLKRWLDLADRAALLTPTLADELRDLGCDNTRHMVRRAANAARFATSIATHPLRGELVALAEELEALGRSSTP
jgi:hypothetical protein